MCVYAYVMPMPKVMYESLHLPTQSSHPVSVFFDVSLYLLHIHRNIMMVSKAFGKC